MLSLLGVVAVVVGVRTERSSTATDFCAVDPHADKVNTVKIAQRVLFIFKSPNYELKVKLSAAILQALPK